jgi:putative ABC transport system permease protein
MSQMMSQRETGSERFYRRCLALYPTEFRDEYGREMRLAFADRLRAAASMGARGVVWLAALSGILAEAPKEHMNVIMQDLRYAIRTMRANPSFAVMAILILALGIGSNTAIFSLMYSVLLRPLPLPNADRIYAVWAEQPRTNLKRISMSGPDLADIEQQSQSFESVAGLLPLFTFKLTGEGEPRIVECTAISPGFFSTLGIHPLLGREYTPEEYHIDGAQVIVSYDFWQRDLGGDPHVIGRILHLQDSPIKVIGVMPPLPDIYPQTDLWPTLIPDFQFMKWRGNKFLVLYGKLKPGVSPEAARQELTAILRRAPETSRDAQVSLVPLKAELGGPGRPILVTLSSAVALVLLIVCVNVATLVLVRNEARKREVAIRLAMGASRTRLLRQWFTEALVLAMLGGLLGTALANQAMRVLLWLGSDQLPRSQHAGINLWVLGFAFLLTLLTSTVCALSPATGLLRTNLDQTLRSGRGSVGVLRRSKRDALIVAEVALSLLLLVGAGDLMRSFSKLIHADPGFSADHLLTSYLRLEGEPETQRTFPREVNFYHGLLADVSALPGVNSAAVADCIPGLRAPLAALQFPDRANDPTHVPTSFGCWISADYFRATRTALLRGRMFEERDRPDSPPVAIVNDAFARRHWPNENPIGKLVTISETGPGRRVNIQPREREVVGVVANVKQHGLDVAAEPGIYMPFYQDETGHVYVSMTLFVRAENDSISLAASLRARLHASQPDLPVTIQMMDQRLMESVAPRRFTLVLLGCFAAIAVTLAASGIYGVVAYSVNRRTKEIGVRMAVGASRSRVLRMILRETMLPVTAGFVLGGLAAIPGARVVANMLFETGPADPLILASASAMMVGVALLAAIVPAYRAASINPLGALHIE